MNEVHVLVEPLFEKAAGVTVIEEEQENLKKLPVGNIAVIRDFPIDPVRPATPIPEKKVDEDAAEAKRAQNEEDGSSWKEIKDRHGL